MSNPIRERYPSLSLTELHDLGLKRREDTVVLRLLWEVRALQAVIRDAWRMEAEHSFAYPNTPEGKALMQLRTSLIQEKWLCEKLPHEKPITAEEKRAYAERNGRAHSKAASRSSGV